MCKLFFAGSLVYLKEKWCRTAGKDPLLGHVDDFQIDPKKTPFLD